MGVLYITGFIVLTSYFIALILIAFGFIKNIRDGRSKKPSISSVATIGETQGQSIVVTQDTWQPGYWAGINNIKIVNLRTAAIFTVLRTDLLRRKIVLSKKHDFLPGDELMVSMWVNNEK